MTATYFRPVPTTCEELKKMYRQLAMENHPDAGGDTAVMQGINAEYERLFPRLKDVHTTKEGKVYTSRKSSSETPEQFIAIIDRLIRMEGIRIEIIGSFIWVSGNTKPYKDIVKELGFRWHSSKCSWFLAPEWYVKRNRQDYSMEEIRIMFGSRDIETEPLPKVTAAV